MTVFRSALLLVLVAVVAAVPATPAADPPANPKFTAMLRDLEKKIGKVRGLEFKTPVQARILPRPADADKGTLGYYTLKDKFLVVYDDVTENYAGGVLIHEMVHALQDQHFGLTSLHDPKLTGDEELARAALIEGDATYTMIQVLKDEQPKAGAMLDVPLAKAKNTRNAFLYAQGARYVQALHQKGGWKAVESRYKFPPTTTAEILHPDERIGSVNLGPGKSRGELGLAEWLKSQGAEWPDAITAVRGWRGDRQVDSERGAITEVMMATPAQADALQGVFEKLAKQKGEGPLPARAVARQGTRLLWVEAKDAPTLARLRDEASAPPRLLITTRQGQSISFGQMIDRLTEADFVCVGESHDSDLHHRIQLQIIQALFAVDPRLGVGMEMFQQPYQASLDGYAKGSLSEEEMLTATEYRTRWGFEWALYQPIVRFCKANGVPLAALNATREMTRRIREVGVDGLKPEEKAALEGIDFNVKAHREHWFDRLAEMHGQANATKEQKEKGYAIMTVWDGYMAKSAAEFLKARHLRRLVVLAGIGHVEHGFGIPDRAAKASGGKAATVKIVLGDEKTDEDVADFTIRVR
jgi:uncharacterized iron-regulated protein